MMKNITMNLKHLVLTFTLAIFAVAANAVNVTYILKPHTGPERTLTGTASVSNINQLLDKMPQALWRAYCTYSFYSDANLTTEITTLPNSNCTVYVDYVFDPPFIMSKEGEEATWNYLRSYNSGGSSRYYVYYCQVAENEYKQEIIKGSSSVPSIGNLGTQVTKKGHREWAFYGDAYDFKIQMNDPEKEKNWLVWSSTSANNRPLTLDTKPNLGWQLYINKATNSKFPNGGMVAMGVPNTTYYFASLQNVSYAIVTENANGQYNDFFFDNHNQLDNNYSKSSLWWYAFFATPVTISSSSTDIWHVTYKIQKEDGVNWYNDIVVQKISSGDNSNLTATWPIAQFTQQRDDCDYDYFHLKSDFSDDRQESYLMPNNQNTVLYIKETLKPVEYVAEQWKTLVLPYTIENVDDYFGTNGVRVLKYESVQGQLNGDAFRCNLIFKPIDDKRIVAGMPYLFKADKVDKKVLENMRNTTEEGTPIPVTKYDTENEDVNVHEIGVSMVGVLDESGYDLPEDDLHFFFGSVPNGDVEDYEHYTYKFYRVGEKIKDINVPRFVCYFYVTPPAGSAPIRVSFGTESITGVSTIVADIKVQNSIYSLDGRKIDATSLDNLKRGIYIVNGRKVVK